MIISTHCTGLYGAQSRDDYTEDDVEQYFNYMGMLAEQVSGSYEPQPCVMQHCSAHLENFTAADRGARAVGQTNKQKNQAVWHACRARMTHWRAS